MGHTLENAIKNASNVGAVREAVQKEAVGEEFAQSLAPCKELVSDTIQVIHTLRILMTHTLTNYTWF